MKTKKCIVCQKEFISKRNPNQICCSRSCNATHHNKRKADKFVPPNCKQCGKPTRRSSRAKFCSLKCQRESIKGEGNPMWKGGRKKHSQGYIMIHLPEHPNSDITGYVMEHRLIMEKHIGRFLFRKEVVHHINDIKDDNRIENLELCNSQAEHLEKHNFFLDARRKNDSPL